MEEKELDKSDLERKAEEVNEGRTPTPMGDAGTSSNSPLEEIKKLNQDTKKMLEKMESERTRMEKNIAELWASGRSIAGQKPQEMTQEEKDQEAANTIMKMLK